MATEPGSNGWIAIIVGGFGSAVALFKLWPRIRKDIGKDAVGLEGVVQGGAERMLDRYEKRIGILECANELLHAEIDKLRSLLFEQSVRHSKEVEAAREERDVARDELAELRREFDALRRQVNGK